MALITVVGTLLSMAVAILAVSYTSQFMSPLPRMLSWISAFVIPMVLSAPIFCFFASKLRELAIAHHELMIIASQDSLTTCLNRGAFITLVDAYLSKVRVPKEQTTGGLLVIDVDNFKAINDRHGHSVGDQALKLIASAIKSVMRATDLVGRIGGEEFAVFLPRSDMPFAKSIAERIRRDIQQIAFMPKGRNEPLSVSVGGTVFTGRVSFNDLFSTADDRLYDAKKRGRNRVEFAPPIHGDFPRHAEDIRKYSSLMD